MPADNLTSGRTLARNSVINFIGQFLPMVVAFFSIPFLIHGVGTARFGIITLIWMVIGYFSIFDMGLGRALTQIVAEKLGNAEDKDIPVLVWTVLLLMLILGIVGGTLLFVLSHWLIYSVLKVPVELRHEASLAISVMSVTIPAVLITSSLGGFLSALQRFDILNVIKVPSGMFNFVGPLLILPFSNHLFWITSIIAFGRVVTCIAHIIASINVFPALKAKKLFDFSIVPHLLSFGGWMTVTNIISPLMVQMDRFIIGAVISVSAVAYYATPYEAVTKLWIIPMSLGAVVFPAFASSYIQDLGKTIQMFIRGTKFTGLLLFPAAIFVAAFAHEILWLWLGHDFASHSTLPMQILVIGVYVNSLGMIFFTLVQGIARPDLTAKLHIGELPFYLVILWFTIHHFGIVGAAIAWVIRVALDSCVLLMMSDNILCKDKSILKKVGTAFIGSSVLIMIPMLHGNIEYRIISFLCLMILYVYIGYKILEKSEYQSLKEIVFKKGRKS